jgi:spermidine/putrescine-binding protein
MKKIITIALALTLAVVLLAPSAFAANEVNVYNWEDYISDEVLELFEEETGIRVNYMRFTTNEDMLVQVTADPSNYDVIFPSDYAIERLIGQDLLETLDYDLLPNASNVLEWLQTPGYDEGGARSVPYMWGTVGILYNTAMVDDVTSWAVLFDDANKDNVFMMDSIRDTIGVALKYLGYSVNEHSQAALDEARDLLIAQKKAGIVKAYQVDETKDKMIAGEAALAVMWSGDAAYAMEFSDDLAYVVPDEGSNIWVDGMCIPKGARNVENAHTFIDFLCRPDIAKLNFEEIWYCTPNSGTIELIAEEDPDLLEDETLFPTQDIIDRCEFFGDILDVQKAYDTVWRAIKTAR